MILVGRIVRIKECAHVDVKNGTLGLVKDALTMNGYTGFAVEVTCSFAADIHALQMRTRTETVFVEERHIMVEV